MQEHFVVAPRGLLGGASELRGWDRDGKALPRGRSGLRSVGISLGAARGPWSMGTEDHGGDTLAALRPGQPILQDTWVVEAV